MKSKCAAVAATVTLLFFGGVNHAQAQVNVQLRSQSTRVRTGEPFNVELRAESSEGSVDSLNLTHTEGFQIVGRQQSMATSFSFGFGSGSKSTQTTVQTLTLIANKSGEYVIGPAVASLGGSQFKSSTLSITASGKDATQMDSNVIPGSEEGNAFLRVEADKNEAFIGEQITIDATLYTRDPLARPLSISKELQVTGAWTQDLLENPTQTEAQRVSIGDQTYYAYKLKHIAAFALGSEPVEVAAMELDGVSGQRFGLRTRLTPIVATSEPFSIKTKAIPGTGQDDPAVGNFKLDAKLDRKSVMTGDAVTVTATVSGSGSLSTIRLTPKLSAGLRALEPTTDEQVEVVGDVLHGSKTYRWIVVAEQPGKHEVGLALPMFNPETRERSTLNAELSFESAGLGASPSQFEPPKPASEGAMNLGFPKTRPLRDEELAPRSFFFSPLSLALLLGCIVLLGAALTRVALGSRAVRRVDDPWQQAKAKIDDAVALQREGQEEESIAALERALRLGIDAALEKPSASMTRADLSHALSVAGLEQRSISQVIELQQELELARFSPMGGDGHALIERTRNAHATLRKRAGA